MELIKQNVYVEDTENGKCWCDNPDGYGWWLKPIEQVFVLTEDEMEQIKMKSYHEGNEAGRKWAETPF